MKLRGTHHAVSSSYRRNHVFMKTRNPFNVMISVELGSHFTPCIQDVHLMYKDVFRTSCVRSIYVLGLGAMWQILISK